ncbi:hypothetical protein [Mycobacterium riyadhense]|uniref:hypothetical protein n=1 Tax=Mycobacterium riyadhense TaxID=486698 RepID=UPI00195C7E43|nr:hypothetical protein [Mycobacterium riyadhense]
MTVVDPNGRMIQTFERSISETMQRELAAEPDPADAWSDDPLDVATWLESEYEGRDIDLWRLVTPMSARKNKTAPLPKLDLSAPLDDQCRVIWERTNMVERRRRTTLRSQNVEYRETYELGHGISPVSKALLWAILDELARQGISKVGTADLSRYIKRCIHWRGA